ncbi:unnamed protein product [Blepharisma stoltei]|uniref:Cytochrome b5 heme-binding domain-containing protein n=1 Tax=Blepharisma stoltei TaxID=1481888 RepID=A0AAU9JW04_9CILI|nr:unnamed protein product [Blepharisma stoltei]
MRKILIILFLIIIASSQFGLRLTRRQLSVFDGRYSKVYIGCAGYIFDVTNSPSFKQGGEYYYLKGKDLTIGLAKQRFDLKILELDPKKVTLTDEEKLILKGWTKNFLDKYPVVGYLII